MNRDEKVGPNRSSSPTEVVKHRYTVTVLHPATRQGNILSTLLPGSNDEEPVWLTMALTYAAGHALLPGKSIAWPEPDEFGRPLGLTPSHGLTRSVFQCFGRAALAAPGVSEVRKELWPGAVLPLGFHLRKEKPVRTGPFA
jgi:hypothetical protein